MSEWAATLDALRALPTREPPEEGYLPVNRAHVERMVARIEAGPPLREAPPDTACATPQGTVVLSWYAGGRLQIELETSDDPEDQPEGYWWWSPA